MAGSFVRWKWIFGESFMAEPSPVMRSHRFISLIFISRACHRPLCSSYNDEYPDYNLSPYTFTRWLVHLSHSLCVCVCVLLFFFHYFLHIFSLCVWVFSPSHIIGVYIYFVNAFCNAHNSLSSATSYLQFVVSGRGHAHAAKAIYNELQPTVNTKPVQNAADNNINNKCIWCSVRIIYS